MHRLVRISPFDAQSRRHTAFASFDAVPFLEDAGDVVDIDEKDLRIDTYRSSGAGGQHVNVTDSAVRITHLPTGLVVSQQDQKSQLQNKLKALEVLRARLLGLKVQQQQDERARMRRSQVGSGDRSEKIRTYNFPQNRLTDHRIGLTLHQLDIIMDGKLDNVIEALITHYQTERMKRDSEAA